MKMQKLMGALILILLMLGATPVTAQNMSDSQVLEGNYIQSYSLTLVKI